MAHFADYEFSNRSRLRSRSCRQAAILNKSAGKVARVLVLHVELADVGYKPGAKEGIWRNKAETRSPSQRCWWPSSWSNTSTAGRSIPSRYQHLG